MSFLKLILKNPFRNKSRAILSILGIGIGILTIVSLGALTNGLIVGAEDSLHQGGSDFLILNKNQTEPLNSNWTSKINNISGVNRTIPVSGSIMSYENDVVYLNAVDPEHILVFDLKVIEGRNYKEGQKEVIMGKLAAEKFNKTVNDNITLNGTNLKIVGIYESGNLATNEDVFSSISTLENITGETGKINLIFVKVNKGVNVEKVTKEIEEKYKNNVSVISSVFDIEQAKQQIDMINAAKWGISLLAIIIGGIGIINTMMMSIYERTREIGVLKAVGWSGPRVIGMILGESIVITLIAGIIGSIFGIIFVQTLAIVGIIEGINPVFSFSIILEAITIALTVGMIGGLYPAIKANKLPPTEALRYE